MSDDQVDAVHNRLLRRLVEADADAAQLERDTGLPIPRIAAWAQEDRTRTAFDGLCELADMQTRLLAGRYSASVLSRLARIALEGEDEALAVRAAKELLALDVARGTRHGGEAPAVDDGEHTPAGELDLVIERLLNREGDDADDDRAHGA